MYSKEEKFVAIIEYLLEGWQDEAPLEYRIAYMLKEAVRYANGHPEWSDIYGASMKPLDDVGINDLRKLIEECMEKAGVVVEKVK